MKLSKMTRPRPTETTADVLGDPVKIVYDRAHINQQFWKFSWWREQLAYVLISWDVTDDTSGKPYAPDESANGSRPAEWLKLFEPIPDVALRPIFDHIIDEFQGGPKAGGDSSAS